MTGPGLIEAVKSIYHPHQKVLHIPVEFLEREANIPTNVRSADCFYNIDTDSLDVLLDCKEEFQAGSDHLRVEALNGIPWKRYYGSVCEREYKEQCRYDDYPGDANQGIVVAGITHLEKLGLKEGDIVTVKTVIIKRRKDQLGEVE